LVVSTAHNKYRTPTLKIEGQIKRIINKDS